MMCPYIYIYVHECTFNTYIFTRFQLKTFGTIADKNSIIFPYVCFSLFIKLDIQAMQESGLNKLNSLYFIYTAYILFAMFDIRLIAVCRYCK